eukprot:CAMPEP_0185347846 /NCGR_PEP_ID=MMETSP1364-20130426/1407_1 /TAXON_ID=38817 /ORGANISM="Gephyrocapsa oceanica, Strain RCC1303" /LENGTH=38 /DNA_ID= /DNA_START= /DNA_END= /DNA_ORIENTATION=
MTYGCLKSMRVIVQVRKGRLVTCASVRKADLWRLSREV